MPYELSMVLQMSLNSLVYLDRCSVVELDAQPKALALPHGHRLVVVGADGLVIVICVVSIEIDRGGGPKKPGSKVPSVSQSPQS